MLQAFESGQSSCISSQARFGVFGENVFNNVSLAFLHGRFGEDWKGLGKVLAGIWEDFERFGISGERFLAMRHLHVYMPRSLGFLDPIEKVQPRKRENV